MKGDDLNSLLTGNPKLSDKFAALYEGLNNRLGAVYARSSDFVEMPGQNSFAGTYQTLAVNPNYLSRHPVYSPEGQRFSFSEDEGDILLLIPQSRESETEKFVEQAQEDWLFDEKSKESRYGGAAAGSSEASQQPSAPGVTYRLYDDADGFFSFDKQVASESGYLLQSPLIKVLTNQNIQQAEKWSLREIGLNAPIRLPSLSDADRAVFYEIAGQCGFAEDSLFLDTLIGCIATEIAQAQSSMNNLVLVFAVLLLLGLVSSFALIHILLISRSRWLNVARYLGYSLAARHWQTAAFIAGPYTLCAAAVGLVTGSLVACGIIGCAALIDIAICTLVLWRREKRSTALLLEGL